MNLKRSVTRRACASVFLALLVLVSSVRLGAAATTDASQSAEASAADEMSDVRQSYLEIRRDWRASQPSPVVPGRGEFGVYLTVDPKSKATLETASVSIDSRVACNERYTDQQMVALRAGASSRLCVGKLAAGTTRVVVALTGNGSNGEPWNQTATVDLSAQTGPVYVQLELTRKSKNGIPEIATKSST